MKDLSITQEYLLCALNKKGKLPSLGNEIPTCFVAGALLDLLNEEFVKIQSKKVIINKELDKAFDYLHPLFSFIERSKPKTIKDLAGDYILTLRSKKLNDLIQSVGNSLVMADCAYAINRRGILGGEKTYYIPEVEKIEYVVQKIRAELLENGNLSDETVALASLLNKSSLLKQYFSKHESKQLRDRINEIKNSDSSRLVKEMLDYIDAIIVVVVTSAGH